MNDDERLSRYLDGELSPEEQAETARRIAEAPELRRDFDDLKQLERTLQQLTPELHVNLPQKMPRPRLRHLRAAALAALVLLAVTGVGWAAVKALTPSRDFSEDTLSEQLAEIERSDPGTVIRRIETETNDSPGTEAPETGQMASGALQSFPSVQVRVRDHDDAPIASASVETYVQDVSPGGRWHYRRVHAQRTGRDGRTELPPADTWDAVRVAKDGYGNALNHLGGLAPINRIELDFLLAPRFRTSGRVVDTAGQPIAGAEITTEPQWLAEAIKWVSTGADGRFEIDGGPGSPLYVRHPDYAIRSSEVTYDGTAGDIIMKRGGNIRVAVTMDDEPLVGAEVFLDDPPVDLQHVWYAETDEFGVAEFRGLSDEHGYTVVASANGALARITAFVREGETQNVRIDLPTSYPARVLGTVLADGTPLEGVPVYLSSVTNRDDARVAVTDETGQYNIGVHHGEYRIGPVLTRFRGRFRNPESGTRVNLPLGAEEREASFSLAENTLHRTNLAIAGNRPLSGRVLLSQFISGGGVWLLDADQGFRSYGFVREMGVFDPDTRLQAFINLPTNEDDGALHIEKIEAHESVRRFEGVVRDTNGMSMENVSVTVRDIRNWGNRLADAWDLTDKEGRFSIDAILNADSYDIRVVKPGYLPREGRVYRDVRPDSNGIPIELIMAPLDRTITGVVISRDGYPVPDATVIVQADGQSRYQKHTDTRGQFTLPLPAGEFMLRAEALGAGSYTVGPIAPPATAVELMVDVWLHEPPPGVSIPTDEQTQIKDNHFKQLGLSFKMFANEHPGEKYPPQSLQYGAFSPQLDMIYPEYAPDSKLIDMFRDESESRAIYFGYAMTEPLAAHAFLDAYETYGPEAIAGQDLEVEPGTGTANNDTLFMLRQGIERFLITDINDPNAGSKAQSTLPIMWELPKEHQLGGWVLYLDGHTEWVEYPGRFPMEPSVIERIRGIMDAARAATPAPSP